MLQIKSYCILFNFLIISYLATFSQPVPASMLKTIDESQVADTLSKGAQLYNISSELSYIYGKPTRFQVVKHSLQDLWVAPKYQFRRSNWLNIGAMIAGTYLLVLADQEIVNKSKQFGNFIGLEGSNNQKNISPIKGIPVFVPTDLPSALYYIGDGFTEMGVNGAFYIYGWVKKDYRALQTASQLTEGMITMGITTQIIKHITGRETDMRKSQPGGKWRWFTDPFIYQKSVPKYDAFPSGHLATAMMTVTIISSNYPEKKIVKPLGYTLMALCGYQMMNNGVHWMSDYPLALAIGYSFGKIAVSRGRSKVNKKDNSQGLLLHQNKAHWTFTPTISPEGYVGFGLKYKM